jgi:type III pantothenate kinase
MLLAIDIGNTSVHLGLFEGNDLTGTFRVPTDHSAVEGAIDRSLTMSIPGDLSDIDSVVLASVVPEISAAWQEATSGLFGCATLLVTPDMALPIKIDVDEPEQLGADRIADAVAAFKLCGGPVIVVDLGTALTVELIDAGGVYRGGAIAPGPDAAMAGLANRAAQLASVPLELPETVIGRTTDQALQAGLFFGTVGQIDRLVEETRREAGLAQCSVVATGGFSNLFAPHSNAISRVEPDLALIGLRLIAEHNR